MPRRQVYDLSDKSMRQLRTKHFTRDNSNPICGSENYAGLQMTLTSSLLQCDCARCQDILAEEMEKTG